MRFHKLTVGLQQKIGQPNFGSIGASCVVEVQLDDSEAANPETVEQRVRQAFARCRRSLDDQLGSQVLTVPSRPTSGQGQAASTHGSRRNARRQATDKQIRAIQAIASKQGIRLASELESRFQVTAPEQLTIGQASALIDALKELATPA